MRKFKYPNDPSDSVCPYCKESQKPCSHIDSLTRAWARQVCSVKYKRENKDE